MRGRLASRKRDEHGEHDDDFEDLGLDRPAERTRFRRYPEPCEVPGER